MHDEFATYVRIGVGWLTNLQPKHRTIDDLECGDYVVDKYNEKSKFLGKCGEVYFLSCDTGDDEDKPLQRYGDAYTLEDLKLFGYTLYQPTEEKETDIDRCIKVVEEYFEGLIAIPNPDKTKYMLVQALKNLKK